MWGDFATIAGSASGAGTPGWVLGLELVAIAVGCGVAMGMIAHGRHPQGDGPEDSLARLLDAVSLNLLTMLLVLVAGCIQLAGDDGLYWLGPAIVVALVNGVTNAWLFLTR